MSVRSNPAPCSPLHFWRRSPPVEAVVLRSRASRPVVACGHPPPWAQGSSARLPSPQTTCLTRDGEVRDSSSSGSRRSYRTADSGAAATSW
eukprot:scaffold28513_cov32-Tisochrysis_lutea.AAC.4